MMHSFSVTLDLGSPLRVNPACRPMPFLLSLAWGQVFCTTVRSSVASAPASTRPTLRLPSSRHCLRVSFAGPSLSNSAWIPSPPALSRSLERVSRTMVRSRVTCAPLIDTPGCWFSATTLSRTVRVANLPLTLMPDPPVVSLTRGFVPWTSVRSRVALVPSMERPLLRLSTITQSPRVRVEAALPSAAARTPSPPSLVVVSESVPRTTVCSRVAAEPRRSRPALWLSASRAYLSVILAPLWASRPGPPHCCTARCSIRASAPVTRIPSPGPLMVRPRSVTLAERSTAAVLALWPVIITFWAQRPSMVRGCLTVRSSL